MVQSKPTAGATGFNGKQVVMYFDENVQVKDANTKFVVSPPLAKNPRVEARGRMVRVDFGESELLPSTTYTLDFADCLSDLNEGNILEGFTFTFSTGESTDSMMISGNVYDARTLDPIKATYVVLQANCADTAFQTVAPIRIAKTDDMGRFAIKNIPDGKRYRVYALDDQNRNFRFDQAGEKIAWLPDSFMPSMEWRKVPDSLAVDSLMADSTIVKMFVPSLKDSLVFTPDSLILLAYDEPSYDQYITSENRTEQNKLVITFNSKMTDKPRFSFPDQDESRQHAVIEYALTNDTATLWLTDTLIYHKDSVVVAAHYPVLDSLKQMVEVSDTLTLWHFDRSAAAKPKKENKRKKNDKPEKKETPLLKVTAPTGIHLYADLAINCNTPYDRFDWSGISLWHKVDTLFEEVRYTTIDDTVNLKHKALKAEWQPGEEYKVEIDSAAVSDIYGLGCGQTTLKFKVNELSRYGALYINVDSVPEHGLLQLVDRNSNVVRQLPLPANGKAAFRYLNGGQYFLRILIDRNGNGRHDVGDFGAGVLPEEFIYYMEQISVRSNWDIKVDFNTHDFTIDKYVRKFKAKNNKKRK